MATNDVPLLHLNDWARESHDTIWRRQEPNFIMLNGIECLHKSLKPRAVPWTTVIVRNEYRLLWDEIVHQSTSMHRGLVVWGSPGIGKSLFLRYALGRALAMRMPIILCELNDYYLYFDDSGVRRIVRGRNDDIAFPARTIALFDTNENMRSPNEHFLTLSSTAFVVQATSPQRSRWFHWSKQLNARMWVMMPWSREEIHQLSDVLEPTPPDHYTAVEIYDYLGPSARSCTTLTPKTYDVERDFSLWPLLSLDDPVQLLNQIQFGNIEDDNARTGFHQYFYAYRLPDVRSVHVRQAPKNWCEYRVPTQFLLRSLFRQIQKKSLVKQKEMCCTLSPLPKICGAAYEVLGVHFFSQQSASMSFRFSDASGSNWSAENFSSSLPIRSLPALSPDLTADFPNVVWVPSVDFPTIDAVAVRDGGKRVTLLQMTIAREHDIKPEGISRIWQLLGKCANDLHWEFLFIVPSDEIGQNLCRRRSEIVQRAPAPLTPEQKRACRPKIKMRVGYTVASFINQEEITAIADQFTYLPDNEVASNIVEVELGYT